MPRMSRKQTTNEINHIIVQGLNKEYIFEKEKYILMYKEIISRKLQDSNIKILSYCIMNNHAHFLIFSEKCEELSKYMQKVNTTYSNFYNKEKSRVGYVFRDRFYSQEIIDQKQLYNCMKYIHNNPVKANMCKEMKDYRYSSFNEFLNKTEKKLISNESIKILFESEDNYMDKFYKIHYGGENDENFIDIKDVNIEDYIKDVEKKYNINIKDIKKDKEKLKEIIKGAREETDATIVELAEILDISKSTVGNYLNK